MYIHSYAILTILLCLSSRYSSVEIRPELQRNILKFGYGINYKYEGMLAHSFDKFYVVTKYILPFLDDLKVLSIRYDKECKYIQNLDDQDNEKINVMYSSAVWFLRLSMGLGLHLYIVAYIGAP